MNWISTCGATAPILATYAIGLAESKLSATLWISVSRTACSVPEMISARMHTDTPHVAGIRRVIRRIVHVYRIKWHTYAREAFDYGRCWYMTSFQNQWHVVQRCRRNSLAQKRYWWSNSVLKTLSSFATFPSQQCLHKWYEASNFFPYSKSFAWRKWRIGRSNENE